MVIYENLKGFIRQPVAIKGIERKDARYEERKRWKQAEKKRERKEWKNEREGEEREREREEAEREKG